MRILTDELYSYLKVQTVCKRQVVENAVLYSFIDESAALRSTECAASLHRTDAERGDTAPGESDLALAGQYWRHLPTER